jgi:hypothetical protein
MNKSTCSPRGFSFLVRWDKYNKRVTLRIPTAVVGVTCQNNELHQKNAPAVVGVLHQQHAVYHTIAWDFDQGCQNGLSNFIDSRPKLVGEGTPTRANIKLDA